VFILFPLLMVHAQGREILGRTSADQIRAEHRIFDIYTNRYQPDSIAIDYLRQFEDSVRIKVFFGTWCHDSKREIPAFFKTLEGANNPKFIVEFIGVSRAKTDPDSLYIGLNLSYTPTFIIYHANKEIGRIIEEPASSIEEDLVEILKAGVPQNH
jgi:thiol-disulfide isomerase/thioredoxin